MGAHPFLAARRRGWLETKAAQSRAEAKAKAKAGARSASKAGTLEKRDHPREDGAAHQEGDPAVAGEKIAPLQFC